MHANGHTWALVCTMRTICANEHKMNSMSTHEHGWMRMSTEKHSCARSAHDAHMNTKEHNVHNVMEMGIIV